MAIHQGAVQVTVTINGSSITIDKENFLSLKIKRYIGDSANSFTLEAFDETAYALESLLMKNQKFPPIVVQYTSARNMNKKITFSGTCFNYQTSFVGKGTLISITGIFSGAGNSSSYWFEKANIEWCGSDPEWDPVNNQWTVDGKGNIAGATDELYTDYLTNENVCAILKFDITDSEEKNVGGLDLITERPALSSGTGNVFIDKKLDIRDTSYAITTSSVFTNDDSNGNSLLSTDAESLANRVKTQCQSNGISALYPVVMAIMMQESGGHYNTYPDVFQCSESLGLPPNSLSLNESLKQGPKYFSQCYLAANKNVEVALQAYNFGIGFANWATKNHNGEVFNTSWIREWKGRYAYSSSYGDENYVANVKRYYRLKDGIEDKTSGTSQAYMNQQFVDVSNTENDVPTVYFNPARIFKRIMKTYRGEGIANSNTQYSSYFKTGKVEDTQWVAGLDTKQNNETAADYINRVLTKNAMTVETDEAGNSLYGSKYLTQTTGFKYFVNGEGHNFVHIDFAANAANAPTFTYGSKDSTIISFSTGKVGAIAMTGNVVNEETGQVNVDEAVLNEISGSVFTIGGEKVLGADVTQEQKDAAKEYKNWYQFQINPMNIESSASTSGFAKRVADTWNTIQNYTTTAEMTVWGEAGNGLEPGGFVNIVVYGNGRSHYSSGCYYITSMEDTITADGYTQTCKMIKNLSNLQVTETDKSYKLSYKYIDGKETDIQLQTTIKYSNGTEIVSYTPVSYEDYTWYKSDWYNSQGQLRSRPLSMLEDRIKEVRGE